MKQKLIMVFAAVTACLWLVSAQAATPNAQFAGTWEVDFSKMPPPPPNADPARAPPKSVTVIIKDAGGGKWSSQVILVRSDGTKREQPPVLVSTDGSPTPVTGDPQIDSVTLTAPDDHTTVVSFSKAGKVVASETSKLSADGRQIVHTVQNTGPDGQPHSMSQTLNRK